MRHNPLFSFRDALFTPGSGSSLEDLWHSVVSKGNQDNQLCPHRRPSVCCHYYSCHLNSYLKPNLEPELLSSAIRKSMVLTVVCNIRQFQRTIRRILAHQILSLVVNDKEADRRTVPHALIPPMKEDGLNRARSHWEVYHIARMGEVKDSVIRVAAYGSLNPQRLIYLFSRTQSN